MIEIKTRLYIIETKLGVTYRISATSALHAAQRLKKRRVGAIITSITDTGRQGKPILSKAGK